MSELASVSVTILAGVAGVVGLSEFLRWQLVQPVPEAEAERMRQHIEAEGRGR